jgi:hypothetical protein
MELSSSLCVCALSLRGECENAVAKDAVDMCVDLNRASKALRKTDAAAARVFDAQLAGAIALKPEHLFAEDLDQTAEGVCATGEQKPNLKRRGEDDLTYRYVRENSVHQVGGRITHSSGVAGGTYASPFTTERYDQFCAACPAQSAQ